MMSLLWEESACNLPAFLIEDVEGRDGIHLQSQQNGRAAGPTVLCFEWLRYELKPSFDWRY